MVSRRQLPKLHKGVSIPLQRWSASLEFGVDVGPNVFHFRKQTRRKVGDAVSKVATFSELSCESYTMGQRSEELFQSEPMDQARNFSFSAIPDASARKLLSRLLDPAVAICDGPNLLRSRLHRSNRTRKAQRGGGANRLVKCALKINEKVSSHPTSIRA